MLAASGVAAQLSNVLLDHRADPGSRDQDGISLLAVASAAAAVRLPAAKAVACRRVRTQGSPANRVGCTSWCGFPGANS